MKKADYCKIAGHRFAPVTFGLPQSLAEFAAGAAKKIQTFSAAACTWQTAIPLSESPNGYYVVETVYQSAVQPRGNTTSGSKMAQYYLGSTPIFSVTVTGSFTYDGSSAKTTSAVGSFAAYASGVTLTGNNAYTSGASAIAWASASYQGSSFRQTVSLTCDPNGNLS